VPRVISHCIRHVDAGHTWPSVVASLTLSDGPRRKVVERLSVGRMASSGMLRRVALVRTDVSEELSSSIIRVTGIGEVGTTLAELFFYFSVRRLLGTANVPSSPILGTIVSHETGRLQFFFHSEFQATPSRLRTDRGLWRNAGGARALTELASARSSAGKVSAWDSSSVD
jgi:hypothetical protein